MNDLLAALCLVLVIEGLLPFAAPRAWKDMLRQLGDTDERTIRIVALICIVTGLVALQFVRGTGG